MYARVAVVHSGPVFFLFCCGWEGGFNVSFKTLGPSTALPAFVTLCVWAVESFWALASLKREHSFCANETQTHCLCIRLTRSSCFPDINEMASLLGGLWGQNKCYSLFLLSLKLFPDNIAEKNKYTRLRCTLLWSCCLVECNRGEKDQTHVIHARGTQLFSSDLNNCIMGCLMPRSWLPSHYYYFKEVRLDDIKCYTQQSLSFCLQQNTCLPKRQVLVRI